MPPLVKIGVWEDGKFRGVVVFSRGASPSLLKPYGLKQSEGCELTRVALTKHSAPVSRIIRIAIALLKKKAPTLQIVVSFADPQQGHHGGIYQAGNWIYTGTTAASKDYYFKGKRLHSRQVSEKGWNVQQGKTRKTKKPSECDIVKTPPKHRYIFPLNKTIRQRIERLKKDYPSACEAGDGRYTNLNSGRAALTHTLQPIDNITLNQ